jgi:hypothetical protein
MFKSIKIIFYIFIALLVLFLYWFLPKYSYITKNPGYCVNLTSHIYYCGNNTGLDKLFK